MNKYLIFRTDRIGDFLISLVLIKSIKVQDANCHITVVTSEKNFEFINSFDLINDVIVLKDGFLKFLLFLDQHSLRIDHSLTQNYLLFAV